MIYVLLNHLTGIDTKAIKPTENTIIIKYHLMVLHHPTQKSHKPTVQKENRRRPTLIIIITNFSEKKQQFREATDEYWRIIQYISNFEKLCDEYETEPPVRFAHFC